MENPWLGLRFAAPYVLDSDRPSIEEHNRVASSTHRLDLSLLPEPFIGRLDAPVVVLLSNPGWCPEDSLIYASCYASSCWQKNLHQTPMEFPMYMIDPQFVASMPDEIKCARKKNIGPGWWERTLRSLTTDFGTDVVSRGLLVVERLAYHSIRYPNRISQVESQKFACGLILESMKRDSVVLCARRYQDWVRAVPQIATYQRTYLPYNWQQSRISVGNYGSAAYLAIAAALQQV